MELESRRTVTNDQEMVQNFRVAGKAILTGEHSVLRGVRAIVLPVHEKFLELTYQDNGEPLQVRVEGTDERESEFVLRGVVEKAAELAGHGRGELTGTLCMKNNLSVGVGLGASAALCVAVGRLVSQQGWVKESDLFHFCRELENIFHGESSGVDIAVVLKNEPIVYQREQGPEPMNLSWTPKLAISYCGQRGVTSECVRKVKDWISTNELRGKETDKKMERASELAILALAKPEKDGILDLVEAIQLARECFDRWDLTAGKLEDHIEKVLKLGALAVKPTGSGGGGHALSLWRNLPKSDIFTSIFPRESSASKLATI
ncbi:MAG: hypothetical protein KDD25_07515 [Bdellovibrionales bacterium]|nr:hypothetical protein [Bdellovibrionales bacterium]